MVTWRRWHAACGTSTHLPSCTRQWWRQVNVGVETWLYYSGVGIVRWKWSSPQVFSLSYLFSGRAPTIVSWLLFDVLYFTAWSSGLCTDRISSGGELCQVLAVLKESPQAAAIA